MRAWFTPLAPYPLAAFRIAFGLYLIAYFLRFAFSVEQCFSNAGVYSPFLIGDVAPGPLMAWGLYAALLAACVAMTIGWHSRLACWSVFFLFEYHYLLNLAVTNTAYDRLNTIALALLCLSNTGAAWSLDARGRTWQALVPAWQIRLPQIQLAMLYFGSGLWKLLNPYWHTGDMVKYTLASTWASPLAYQVLELHLPDWCFTTLTWAVIAFELTAGPALFFRLTRPWFIAAGALFHLSNAFVLVIPEFLNCLCFYALFLPWRTRGNRSK